MNLDFYQRQLVQKILSQDSAIGSVFNLFTKRISPLLTKYRYSDNGAVIKNASIEKQIQAELDKLQSNLETLIRSSTKWAWTLSNEKNNALVKDYVKEMSVSNIIRDGFMQENTAAYDEFINRKVAGLNISDRVWNVTKSAKDQVDYYMTTGVADGKSASLISQDVRQLLKNPDARFRRVTNSKGKLVPSNPMKAYNPGQGTYRSAHQNAMRLAVTETNMSYAKADLTRWGQLDFVVGYEVKLSNNHPTLDICDSLKGLYPEDFVFLGWHPRCRCYMVPVMVPKDEFLDYLDASPEERKKIQDKYRVKNVPEGFNDFVGKHKDQISKWKSQPYWVRDNFKDGSITKGLSLGSKEASSPVKGTAFSAARTQGEAARWAMDNGLAKSVNYGKLSNIDLVNETNRSLLALKDRTGLTFDAVKAVNRASSRFINAPAYTETSLNKKTKEVKNTLSINNAYFEKYGGSFDQVNEIIKKELDKNWWVAEKYRDLINHEFGHKLTMGNSLLNRLDFSFSSPIYDKSLSQYASTSFAETLAELFAKYMKGDDIPEKWKTVFNKWSDFKI